MLKFNGCPLYKGICIMQGNFPLVNVVKLSKSSSMKILKTAFFLECDWIIEVNRSSPRLLSNWKIAKYKCP